MLLLCIYFKLCFGAAVSVHINEIFPRAHDSPEWLELYNGSDAPINVKGWHYGKNDDSVVVSLSDQMILSRGFLVLTKDIAAFSSVYPDVQNVIQLPHWYTLDNYHDTIVLWDASAVARDTAAWDSKWFSSWTTQDLSRVTMTLSGMDKRSWVLSDNPSPGKQNPETTWHAAAVSALEIGPVPFTPNNDGKDDYLVISLLLAPGASATVSIYGFDGKKYYEIANVLTPQILWNGNTSSGLKMPCGPFFVVAEVNNNGVKSIIRKKGVLWR